MTNFQNQPPTASELKAKYQTKQLLTFSGHLAEKGVERPYSEENKTAYYLNWIGILLACTFRVAAGFSCIFYFIKGVFGFTGDAAVYLAASITITMLLGLEYRQVANATLFLETWFFRAKFLKPRLMMYLFLSSITVLLGVLGVDDAVNAISPSVARNAPTLLDEKATTAHYADRVKKAEADARDYKNSSSWGGKLDTKDRRRYNDLLLEAKAQRDSLTAAIAAVKIENRKREDAAEKEYRTLVKAKGDADNSNVFFLTVFLFVTEFLFLFCFFHKEKYEYLVTQEKILTGEISRRTPYPTQPPHQNQPHQNGQKNHYQVPN